MQSPRTYTGGTISCGLSVARALYLRGSFPEKSADQPPPNPTNERTTLNGVGLLRGIRGTWMATKSQQPVCKRKTFSRWHSQGHCETVFKHLSSKFQDTCGVA